MKNNRYSLYSLIASAIVLLLGDVLQVLNHESILWTICLALSFVLFVGGIPAINSLIHTSNLTPRLIINIFLHVGAIAGASMQVLFRAIIILENEKFSEAALALSNSTSLKLTTMVPGIFYPLGLILLCIALFFCKKISIVESCAAVNGCHFFPGRTCDRKCSSIGWRRHFTYICMARTQF